MYWFFVSLFNILTLIFFYLTLRRYIDGAESFIVVGNLIAFIAFILILFSLLINVDYSYTKIEKICPNNVSVMHNDEERIVKYDWKRWETSEHSEYVKIVNNRFFIQKYKTFNVFGQDNGYTYEIEFSDDECFEPIAL